MRRVPSQLSLQRSASSVARAPYVPARLLPLGIVVCVCFAAAITLLFLYAGQDGSPGFDYCVAVESSLRSGLPDRRSHFNGLMRSALQQLSSRGAPEADAALTNRTPPLRVCLFTADVPFSAGSGGTATAFLSLGEELAKAPQLRVTLVGLERPPLTDAPCDRTIARALAAYALSYDCVRLSDARHEGRELVSTQYWEAHSLAVLRWLDRHSQHCDLVHGHEWGGVFAYLALVLQLEPERYGGLHLLLATHGGYMWSQIGLRRPNDVNALRTDHMEKLSVEWADTVLSPSRYMLGYFATRGWRVAHRLVLPNIVKQPAVAAPHRAGLRRPVWKLFFIGRLEERKGIRIFMDLVERLNESQYWKRGLHSLRPPQVYIAGSGDLIDGESSVDWINGRIRSVQWAFPITLLHEMDRTELVSRLQQDGAFLVVPSLQENVPYVLAEAATLGVPLVTFDVGGSREVLQLHPDDNMTFCSDVTMDSMYRHVHGVLASGSHYMSSLAPSMAGAGALWLRYHAAYGLVRQRLSMQSARHSRQQSEPEASIQTISLSSEGSVRTGSLLREACSEAAWLPGELDIDAEQFRSEELLLLLPAQFELIPRLAQSAMALFARAFSGMSGSKRHMRTVGALTFGVQLDNASYSYATAPTWLLYSRDSRYCEHHFPIVIRRQVLCQAFAVDVHVFHSFEPWLLADVLTQQGLQLVTHPDVLFHYRPGMSAQRLTPHSQCEQWTVPIGHYRSVEMLDHLHRDVSEEMRDLYFPRRAARREYVDLTTAIRVPTVAQSQRGWSFVNGSIGQWKLGAVNDDGSVHWLTWYPAQLRYGCNESPFTPHPYVDYYSVVHPCRSTAGECCAASNRSRSLLRYSFSEEQSMTSRDLLLQVTFKAQQRCGDGVRIAILLFRAAHGPPEELLSSRLGAETQNNGTSHRWPVLLHVRSFDRDSTMDVYVDPLSDHHCDGVYVNIKLTE